MRTATTARACRLKATDEIGRLATAFNRMATDVEAHQRAAVGQERVKRELELGRQIQHEMLPHEPLRLGLTEIKGVSVPAREVGGDFFNYFELPDHRIALLVGDVSGKGVGAALLMANIQASLARDSRSARTCRRSPTRSIATSTQTRRGRCTRRCSSAFSIPATRMLQYVNAGHHPQYALCRAGSSEWNPLDCPSACCPGRGYTARDIQLGAGDLIFFYTDGCVEAENPAGDMFGRERLEATLMSAAAVTPDEVLHARRAGGEDLPRSRRAGRRRDADGRRVG